MYSLKKVKINQNFPITIINAKEQKAFIGVDGKSEQEGTPSPSNPSEIHSVADDVNLLQNNITTQTVNGITFTKNDDGTITANGTATANATIDVGRNLTNLFSKGDYIASGCPNRGTSSTYQITLFKTVNSTISALGGDFGDGVTANITEDCYLWERIVIYSGQTVSNLIFKPKIAKGTKATPYSPYNQGTVTIKQRGKNLFDLKAYLTNRGVTYTENSDGSITFSTTTNLYSNTFTFSSSNTNVSLSGIITNGTATNGRIQLLNSSNVVVGEITSSKINYENLNANQLRFNYSTSGTITLKNIQLEEGSTATPYEPYQGNDYTIQTEPLRSLPNGVKDTIEEDGIHKKMFMVDMGDLEWILRSR